MFKKAFISLLIASGCFALSFDYDTFEATFTQTVKNKSGKKIEYAGKLIAKKPNRAVWEYTKPIKKSVFVKDDVVIIFEPELLQAKYLRKKGMVSLESILKNAKSEGNDMYSARDGDITYRFKVSDNMIEKLTYRDSLENDTEIVFKERKKNIQVSEKTFDFKPGPEIDIIK